MLCQENQDFIKHKINVQVISGMKKLNMETTVYVRQLCAKTTCLARIFTILGWKTTYYIEL